MVEKEIREYPNLRRQPDPVLISDIHREQGQLPIHQNRLEPAGQDIALHDIKRLDENAEARKRCAADNLAVIAVEGRRDTQVLMALHFSRVGPIHHRQV